MTVPNTHLIIKSEQKLNVSFPNKIFTALCRHIYYTGVYCISQSPLLCDI